MVAFLVPLRSAIMAVGIRLDSRQHSEASYTNKENGCPNSSSRISAFVIAGAIAPALPFFCVFTCCLPSAAITGYQSLTAA
jgi:hypothetical protein